MPDTRPSLGPAFVVLVALLAICLPPPADGECVGDFLVSPSREGSDDGTLLENFHALVDDLYASDAVQTIEVAGKTHLTPPWFASSTECSAAQLKDGEGEIESPSFDDFALNGDELSELAIVLSLSDDPERMEEIHHTVEAMSSPVYAGMPCWLARVRTGPPASIECIRDDTASDVTARIGLAYYHAAHNPHFPQADRDLYLAEANALVDLHLAKEYASGETFLSRVTHDAIADWVGGGANTAESLAGLKMWIGYHQDIAMFLLAAHAATGENVYLQRAQDVVDQWLMASEFDGETLTFGRFNFAWDTTADPYLDPKPGDAYWWQQNRAWDAADAPRSLWMGHVLRARVLATGGAPAPEAYEDLSAWIAAILATDTQTPTTSCVEYNQDGSVPIETTGTPKNCGTDYYYNGLGAGLLTFHATAWLETKLDTTLPQYGWSGGKTWNGAPCFGLYRGVRPLKALAAALGLDAATFGGTRPGACARLDVARDGPGSGFVTSPEGGVDCGIDCVELYPIGHQVALDATPYAGSSFDEWSGDGCSSGDVDMSVARTCTASFEGACDPLYILTNQTVTTTELFVGCGEVRAGSGFVVEGSGDVTLRAGNRVVLTDGFSVRGGGRLTAIASGEPAM